MNFPEASHTFLFKQPIWKIHPTGTQHQLLVETRDAKHSIIVFYAINTQTNTCLQLPSYTVLNHWWCSLEYCNDQILIFSEFKDPNLPQPKGLIAYEYISKSALWELKDISLHQAYNELFIAIDQNKSFKMYDYTGKETTSTYLTKPESHITSPLICSYENSIFQDFLLFLQQNTLPAPHKTIEYYESDCFLVLSYAYIADSKQQYKLLIFDNTGHKTLDEHIFKNNKGFIDACFFIFGKSVLFLDNDYCLKGYEIA